MISYDDFEKVDIRTGVIIKVESFPKARNPSYKVWVDFGEELGTKQTSAQIAVHYESDGLIGKQVLGCINLGEKNIVGFTSEFLLLGFSDAQGAIILATTEKEALKGKKMH